MINIKKSEHPPKCLSEEKKKANGDYKCGEVLDRLKEDFHNKCYLCEEKEPSTINVEHFIPHQGNKDLKFDWKNLFWACGHCNNTKLAKYKNIIDCTDFSRIVTDFSATCGAGGLTGKIFFRRYLKCFGTIRF